MSLIGQLFPELFTPKDGFIETHNSAYFLKTFPKSMCYLCPKTPEICRKVLLSNFFILPIQIELGKAIFNQIWDFRTAS